MRSKHVLFRGLGEVSLAVIVVTGLASCTDDDLGRDDGASTENSSALTRIDDVRARFLVDDVARQPSSGGVLALQKHSALGAAVATGFIRTNGARASSHLAPKLGSSPTARVEIPRRASDPTMLEDLRSHLRVGFALHGTNDTTASVAGGYVLYPGAYAGADVIHRVTGEGTEDFVLFERRPEKESLAYDVDVSEVAGLRLVSNTLELLDREGTPALRVAAPYVVDSAGVAHQATLAVEGCAYDSSTAGPWGRAVVAPGAAHCTMRVDWHDVAYPALVDPSWGTTGLLDVDRWELGSTLLTNGKVLITGGIVGISGGYGSGAALLYDPATNTFAATGSMNFGRRRHGAHLLPSGKVLVSGGAYQDNGWGYVYTTSTQIYDPATGTFSAGPTLPEAPSAAVSLANGDVLLVGGDFARQSGIYRAATNTITATGSSTYEHCHPTLTRLSSGKVLVAGGGDDQGWYPPANANAEIFDPAANGGVGAYVSTGSLPAARPGAQSVLLPSGKVLVTGSSTTTDIFDPAANGGIGAFTAGPATSRARYFPSATLLPTGRVLIAGSYQVYSSRAEIYDPVTGVVSQGDTPWSFGAFHGATTLPSGKVLLTGDARRHGALYDASTACTFPGVPPTLTGLKQKKNIKLTWTAGSPAPTGGYRVYRHAYPEPLLRASVSSATLTYTDTGLPNLTSFTYVVKAWNDCNGNGVFDLGIDTETSSNADVTVNM
jgi:hypothetical protein